MRKYEINGKTARAVFLDKSEHNKTSDCTILFKAGGENFLRLWFDKYENDVCFPIEILNTFICHFQGCKTSIYLNSNYECRSVDNVLIISKNEVFFTEKQQSLNGENEKEFELELENFQKYVLENPDDFKKNLTKLDGTPKQIAQDLFEDFSAEKERWSKFVSQTNKKHKSELLKALELIEICLKENKTDDERKLLENYVAKVLK